MYDVEQKNIETGSQENIEWSVHSSKLILCVSNQSTQKTIESVKFYTVLIRLSK